MKGFEQIKQEELKDFLEDDELMELFENGEIVNDFQVKEEQKSQRNYSEDLIIN